MDIILTLLAASALAVTSSGTPDSKGISTRNADELREAYRMEMESRNAVGALASDFRFLDLDGRERTLHGWLSETGDATGFPTDEQRVLLLFYDNDCSECRELERSLGRSAALARETESGRWRVLAVEAFGADAEAWRVGALTFPQSWTVGLSPDGEVEEQDIYWLPAAPVAYVLDGEGRVVSRHDDFSGTSLDEVLAKE